MSGDTDAPWRDEETLRQKYLHEGHSSRELAELWDCDKKTILNWLRKFDIPRDNSHMEDKPWQDKETLRELYLDQGLTCDEIGDELGCSGRTVYKWLNRFDLYRPYRDKEWLDGMFNEKDLNISQIADRANSNRHTISFWLDYLEVRSEGDRPAPHNGRHTNGEALYYLYKEQQKSTLQIADEIGCSPSAVRRGLIENDIDRRPWWLRGDSTVSVSDGYREVSFNDGDETCVVGVHRLVALAHGKITIEGFYDFNTVVHHINEVRWDNRPENLQPMSRSEHTRLHQLKA